jgi:hypothetical protein
MARTNRSRQATFRDAQAPDAARASRNARRRTEADADPDRKDGTTEKKTETPRARNREWGFFGTCVHNGHTDPEAAWDEAMAALTDPKGHFRLEPEDARDLLDATWGRHLADQVVGQKIAKAIHDLAVNHGWALDARNFVRKHINPRLPGMTIPKRGRRVARALALREIARRILKLETLETRNSDALDFHELAVWTIQEALDAAYEAGRQSAAR